VTSYLSHFLQNTVAVIERYQWKNLNSSKNIRIFQNPILEKLTYIHPLVPHAFWLPVIFWMFQIEYTLWSIAGLLFWSFAEYLLHRFVFHFEPTGTLGKRIAFIIHGIHHNDPNDERRLVMPPTAGAIIALLLYSIFFGILGPVYTSPFFAGFLFGYLIYDSVHFAVHAFRPSADSILGKLKSQHMKHHFVSHDRFYGVSSTLWDRIFGTN